MTNIIVVGFIPTPEGEAALQRAMEEASAHDAELIVVNSSKRDSLIDDKLVDATGWSDMGTRLESAGIRHRLVQPKDGYDPADVLLEACSRNKADLVVIGLRKRSTVGKLLLGSTAQRILMQADCDILSVRAS